MSQISSNKLSNEKCKIEFYIPILLWVSKKSINSKEVVLDFNFYRSYFKNYDLTDINYFYFNENLNYVSVMSEVFSFLDKHSNLSSVKIRIDNIDLDFPYIDLKSIDFSGYDPESASWSLGEPPLVNGFNYQLLTETHPFTYSTFHVSKDTFLPSEVSNVLRKHLSTLENQKVSLGFSKDSHVIGYFPHIFYNSVCVRLQSIIYDTIFSWGVFNQNIVNSDEVFSNLVSFSRKASFNIVKNYVDKSDSCFVFVSSSSFSFRTTRFFIQQDKIKEDISKHIGLDFIKVVDVREVELKYHVPYRNFTDSDVSNSDFLYLQSLSFRIEDDDNLRYIYAGPCYKVTLSFVDKNLEKIFKDTDFYVATPEQYNKTLINMGRPDLVESWNNKPDFIFITSPWCEKAYGFDDDRYPMASPNFRRLSFKAWLVGVLPQRFLYHNVNIFNITNFSKSPARRYNKKLNSFNLLLKEELWKT